MSRDRSSPSRSIRSDSDTVPGDRSHHAATTSNSRRATPLGPHDGLSTLTTLSSIRSGWSGHPGSTPSTVKRRAVEYSETARQDFLVLRRIPPVIKARGIREFKNHNCLWLRSTFNEAGRTGSHQEASTILQMMVSLTAARYGSSPARSLISISTNT